MAREQEYDEEEETEEIEEAPAAPTPAQVKKVVKKAAPGPAAKSHPASQPQVQYIKIPVFESQAQQIFYDTLLAIDAKLQKVDADLELMKKYLPQ